MDEVWQQRARVSRGGRRPRRRTGGARTSSSACTGASTCSSATVSTRVAQRARRRPRAPARARPVGDAGEEGEEQPGGDPAERAGAWAREALDLRRGHDVAELQVPEPGEGGEPERADEGDGGRRELQQAGGAPPRRPAQAEVRARHRRLEPVGHALLLAQGGPPQQAGPRLGQPLRRPRAATARAPAATWARWTGVGAGSEARSRGPGLGVHAVGQPQAPQRVGPQAQRASARTASRRRARRAAGAPGPPPARRRARPPPARARPRAPRDPRARCCPRGCRRSRRPGARRAAVTSAASRVAAASRSATRSASTGRSAPRPRGCGRTPRARARPAARRARSSAPRSARQARGPPASSRSAWLSTTSIASRVARERPQVVLVQRGVGVLLRVDDPHHEVGERDHAVDLEAVRRARRSRSRAGRAGRARPARRPHAVAARHLEPVEQRVADAAPHRRARGRRGGPPVAGRGRARRRRAR